MNNKKILMTLKKMISVMLAFLLFAGSLAVPSGSIFSTVVQAADISPFQTAIVEGMSLPDGTRTAFADNILGVIATTGNVTDDLVTAAGSYLTTMNTTDIRTSLETFAGFSDTRQGLLIQTIKEGLPASLISMDGFPDIASVINDKVTGNPGDIRGLKFLVKLLSTVVGVTGPIARNGSPVEQIEIELIGNDLIKSVVSALIDSAESLKAEISLSPGSNNFDKLLSYCENTANSYPTVQIAAFKAFLRDNGGIYEGNIPILISPLQRVILETMSLTSDNRNSFVTNALGAVTSVNDVTDAFAGNVKTNYLPSMTVADIMTALLSYNGVSDDGKTIMRAAITEGLPASLNSTGGFPVIASTINEKITGNSYDSRGLKFLIKLLQTVKLVTGPVATDGDPVEKIRIEVNGFDIVKSQVSSLIDSAETLKAEISLSTGSNNFDKLLSYCQTIVNLRPNDEIAAFKTFLQDNGGIYASQSEPTPTPTPTPETTPPPDTTPTPTQETTPPPTPTSEPTPTPSPNETFVVNPAFAYINAPENNLYEGFWEDPNISRSIRLENTGIVADYVVINGMTTYSIGSTPFSIPFKLKVDRDGGNTDDYRINVHFTPEADTNNYLDPNEVINNFSPNGSIPVVRYAQCNVELTYNFINADDLEDSINTSLQWSNNDNNSWGAEIFEQSNRITASSPEADAKLNNFSGDISQLKLEARYSYYNSETQLTDTVVVAELRNMQFKSWEIVNQNLETIYTFSYREGDINLLGQEQFNNQQVQMFLIYGDPNNGGRELMIKNLLVDNSPPEPNIEFKGVQVGGAYDGKYKVQVWFNDDVDPNNLSANKDIYFTLKSPGPGGTVKGTPLAVVPYRESNFEGANTDPCYAAILFFDYIKSEYKLETSGVSDIVGNTMTEAVSQEIRIEAKISGHVYLNDGTTPIASAEIQMIWLDSAEYVAEGSYKGLRTEKLYTDPNGQMYDNRYINSGEYHIRSIRYNDVDRGWIEVPVDQNVTIPYVPWDQTHELNITLNNSNVSGIAIRDIAGISPEKLVFIKTDYLTGQWANFDQFMIYNMFGIWTEIRPTNPYDQNDPNGYFNLYLSPGNYMLIGKEMGFLYIPPKNDVEFTVPETGNYDIATLVEFPTMNVTGIIKKPSSDPNAEPEALAEAVVIFMDPNAEPTDEPDPSMMAFTNQEGAFAAALGEGNYVIAAVMEMGKGDMGGPGTAVNTGGMGTDSAFYMMDVTFSVDSQGDVGNIQGLNQIDGSLDNIVVPNPNVSVEVVEGGTPVKMGASITLNMGDGRGPEIWSSTGRFNYYLTPGTYTVGRIFYPPDIIIDNLGLEIPVDPNTNLTGENALEIDLAGESNVLVTVVTAGELEGIPIQIPVQNAGIQIEGKSNGIWQWRETNASGNAYFNLEPGKYRINGYSDASGWHQYDYEFDVTEATTKDNQLPILIEIKEPNVSGTVLDESQEPVQWGWISIKKMPTGDEIFPEYFGSQTGEFGEFALNLGAGVYVVEGVGSPDGWLELNYKFTVVDDLSLLDSSGTPVAVLTLRKPSNNIKGYVYKAYNVDTFTGTTYKGRTLEQGYDSNFQPTDVWLILQRADVAQETINQMPWFYEKWVEVEVDGSFGIYVDADLKYKPRAIIDAGRWVDVNISAVTPASAVGNGAIIPDAGRNLIIVPSAANFSGTIQDFEGGSVTRGWLNLERIDPNADYNVWEGMEIDNDGKFERNLELGADYIIREAYIMSNNPNDPWGNSTRYVFNKRVTIGADTRDIILKPNVKGNVDLGGKVQNDYNYQISASIRTVVSNGDYRYSDYLNNPWKYDQWVTMSEETDPNASWDYVFQTYLDAGNYILVGISAPGKWIELNQSFTIDDVDAQNILTFDCQPNVTGIIRDSAGNTVPNAWVNFERVIPIDPNEPYVWDPSNYFGSNTNGIGEFGLKLDTGNYRLNGYSTPGVWTNGGRTWQPGQWVQLSYNFKVNELNQLCNVDGELIDKIIIAPNVSGNVMKVFDSSRDYTGDFAGTPVNGQYAQVKDAWITIKPLKTDANEIEYVDYNDWSDAVWTNTGNTGEFSLMLSPGKYRVLDVGMRNFWMKADIDFEINNENELADEIADPNSIPDDYFISNPNDSVIGGKLVIRQQMPNVRGIAYRDAGKTQAVKWGWIAIKPGNAKDFEWNNVIWMDTKEDGSFETKLPDGNWKIADISGPGYWMRVNIPITVQGSSVTSTINGIVQEDGTLKIGPQQPNFTGYVKDREGNNAVNNAWLTVMNVTGGEKDVQHDWSKMIGVEYGDKDGTGVRKFAEYLDEGKYKIINVGSWDFWYETDIKFTINSSGALESLSGASIVDGMLIVSPPVANAHGTVYSGQSADPNNIVSNGWIGFARYDQAGTQLTFEGDPITSENEGWIAPGDDLYWWHTRWTEIDPNGNFEFYMPDGRYKVISVGGSNVWYRPDTEFKVEGNTLSSWAGVAIDEITVTQPGPNMTITVKNSGAGVNDDRAWIEIKDVQNGFIFSIESTTRENGDYVFEARLKQGLHTVVGFGTYSMWTDVDIDPFNVSDTSEVTIDFNAVQKEKVYGTAYNTVNNPLQKAWVSVRQVVNGALTGDKKWVQTNESGQFYFKLNPGETWAVVDVTTSIGYGQVADPVSESSYTVQDTVLNTQTAAEWTVIYNNLVITQ